MTYGHTQPHILAAVDLDRVRAHLLSTRKRLGLTQHAVAERTEGVDQGQISRIERPESEPMPDLAARVLFQIIENGLKKPLSQFFAEIEGSATGQPLATPPAEPRGSANEPLPAPTEEDYRTTIRLLAAIAAREAERADAAHRRLPPGAAGEPPGSDRDRVRHVRGPVPRSRKRRSGKRG
jgi:transcriptional regulator with XRE-family HTH domain